MLLLMKNNYFNFFTVNQSILSIIFVFTQYIRVVSLILFDCKYYDGVTTQMTDKKYAFSFATRRVSNYKEQTHSYANRIKTSKKKVDRVCGKDYKER